MRFVSLIHKTFAVDLEIWASFFRSYR